jgi:hypothetical protein
MDLSNKTHDDLKSIARQMGLNVHHKSGRETFINEISKELNKTPQREKIEVQEDEPLKAEDVIEALKPFTDEYKDFEVLFLEDNTWMFRKGKLSESGNMVMPLGVVKRKAELFCRQRPLRALGRDASDNTYTGTVLTA